MNIAYFTAFGRAFLLSDSPEYTILNPEMRPKTESVNSYRTCEKIEQLYKPKSDDL